VRIRKHVYRYLLRTLAVFAIPILFGCGSSGSDTSGLMIDYSPLPHNVTENHVDIIHNIDQSIGNRLAVDIRVTQITEPVFNAALDLAYDPNVVQFLYHVPGNFLEATSQNVSYVIAPQSTASNDLVVGVSQTGSDPGSNSTSSGILVTLVFEPRSPGCSVLNFAKLSGSGEKSALVTTNGSVINGITFSQGGTIRVRQEGDTGECVPDPQNP